uniref:HTH marR-type domain-containing protein n=1 Tax=Caulobacter phage BL57 TaxID=3348355 RepID=A0AB74ULE9_9VIRU
MLYGKETRMIDDDSDWDDGELNAPRAPITTKDLNDVAQGVAGGRLAAMRAAGEEHRREFLMLRGPLGVVRLSLAHTPVLHALWRVWSRKRLERVEDPGASLAEIGQEMGQEAEAVRAVIASLLKNQLVRSRRSHVGWQGNRATYYPSEIAVQALALAEVLGPGHAVQVGRNASAWANRSQTEPGTLFQHAALLRGGAQPRAFDTEYS